MFKTVSQQDHESWTKLNSTYKGSSSNDLTECSGELGSFRCTSTSCVLLTSLFLRAFRRSEDSAMAVAVFSIRDDK